MAAIPSDGAANVASKRTLGTGETQAAAGNHAHTGVYEPAGAAAAANGTYRNAKRASNGDLLSACVAGDLFICDSADAQNLPYNVLTTGQWIDVIVMNGWQPHISASTAITSTDGSISLNTNVLPTDANGRFTRFIALEVFSLGWMLCGSGWLAAT